MPLIKSLEGPGVSPGGKATVATVHARTIDCWAFVVGCRLEPVFTGVLRSEEVVMAN
jgi:hypothetical protein